MSKEWPGKTSVYTGFVVLCALFLLVNGCADPAGSEAQPALKVMLIGVDGATWDIMAPMIAGSSFNTAKTVVPRNLLTDGGFKKGLPPGRRATAASHIVDTAHSGDHALLLVDDDPDREKFWQATLDLEGLEGDRLLVEGWIRHPEGSGAVTVEVRGHSNLIPRRWFETGPQWQPFSFQMQVPPDESKVLYRIHPHRLTSPENFRAGMGRALLDDLSVREVRRMRFPQSGFTARQLNAPQNRLPAISRLIRDGACGPLGTFDPNESPSLWTTAVTGKRPEEHGVPGFFVSYPGREEPALANSTLRKTRALWNMVGQSGDDQVVFVSWWVTWPAEEVNGVMVSDHASRASREMLATSGYLKDEDLEQHEDDQGLTYPHQLMSEIQPLMLPPASVTAEMISEYADLLPADRRRVGSIERMNREELSLLKFKLAAYRGNEDVSRHLYTTRNPRLFGVYFDLVDAMEHYFWRWMEPELFLHAPAERVAVFGETLERVYALQDQTIHRLHELADENTVIIILSDHGHRPVRLASDEGKSGGHSAADPGIIIMSGGPIRAGSVIEGATLLDITPTVLYLLGYPVARDMPGRVLTEAFESSYMAAHPIELIDTYEGEARAVDQVFSSAEDERIGEELRALGYIE
jgi:hypothetical protein